MLEFSTERDRRWFGRLQAHLPDKQLWEKLTQIKKMAPRYPLTSRRLVEAVVEECLSHTQTASIRLRWPEEGIAWSYPPQFMSMLLRTPKTLRYYPC